MFRHLFFLPITLLLCACGQNQQGQQHQTNTDSAVADSLAILNDPKNNLNIQMTNFSEIDSSGILMFPLSMEESERPGNSSLYKDVPVNSYWNIIFLNARTDEYHLLSDRKMLIRDVDYSRKGAADVSQTNKYIFYAVTVDDLNGDKKLTDADPEYLFVSDRAGNDFRQISPANYHLQNWKFIKSANKVFMTVKKDSDKNSKFEEKDEVTTFEFDIDKEVAPKEVFSTEFKNQLKVLYDRDWKRLKK